MKPHINNTAPFTPSFLKTRAKQEKMKESMHTSSERLHYRYIIIAVRQSQIQYENMKILKRMVEIETKPGPLSPSEMKRKSFHPTRSLGVVRKMQEWQRINEENRVAFLFLR